MPKFSITTISKESTPSETSFDDEKIHNKKGSIISYRLRIGLFVFAVLLALLGVGVGIPTLFELLYQRPTADKYIGVCSINPRLMVECFPVMGEVNIDTCLKWDCCWRDESDEELNTVSAPRCYHRLPSSYRLMITDEQLEKASSTTNESNLQFPLQLHTYQSSVSQNWIRHNQLNTTIQLSVSKSSNQRFQLRFTTNYSQTFNFSNNSSEKTADNFLYDVKALLTVDGCVDICVTRRDTGRRIFSINCFGTLITTPTYTEMTILLPANSSLYGLGFINKEQVERSTNNQHWILLSTMATFEADSSMYGAHPQYLCIEPDGNAHGVLFDTSHVIQVSLSPIPALIIRTPGPILDIHIALGPRPVDVVSQLTDIPEISDRPALPPFWALGYHLCPFGEVDFVNQMKNLSDNNIPLASHCIDSSIYQKLMFEDGDMISKQRRLDLRTALIRMKQSGTKVLALVIPQVAMWKGKSEDYTYAFDKGVDMKVFLPSYYSKHWDDVRVVFPDPTQPNASTWMKDVLDHASSRDIRINFDGFILHWNTPQDLRNETEHPCDNSPVPPLQNLFTNVSKASICSEVRYYNGQMHKQVVNKYGQAQTALLAKAINIGKPKRPFIVSLASFTGIGQWGGTWGGMYSCTWEALQTSFSHVQEASMYGIPLSGVPICGNLGSVDSELCGRWFQIGAFYPLALSIYDADEGERSPLAFNKAFTFFARQVIRLRYSLLAHLYTLFYEAHKNGSPVLRPLFFEFPQYQQTRSEKNVFLWGEGLLFIPCLEKKKESAFVWLPRVDWYEFYSGKLIEIPGNDTSGKWITIPAPIYYVNLFIRGGYMVFTQLPGENIAGTRKSPYKVYVGLNRESVESRGYLFIDDGESIGGLELHVTVHVKGNVMTLDVEENVSGAFAYLESLQVATVIDYVRIYGIDGIVGGVKVDGKITGQILQSSGVLEIKNVFYLNSSHLIEWIISSSLW